MDKKRQSEVKEQTPLKYDLGCGQRKQQGFIGVDCVKMEGVDIVFNLESYPWMFTKDNSVDEVYCSHYIEHVKEIHKFMDEIWRILKVGGKATIIAPYYSSVRAMQDPFHVRPISEATFLYYNKGWRDLNKLEHYNIKADFDFEYAYTWHPDFVNKAAEVVTFAAAHYINAITDITVLLTKRKPQ
jgi:ubiquinone/menaquinone biosynthesis C-methylase UbiE